MTLPPGAFDDLDTTIVLAVLGGDRTFRQVARTVGAAPSAVYGRAVPLRAAGLVSWEPGTTGTLRPGVRPVLVRPRPARRRHGRRRASP